MDTLYIDLSDEEKSVFDLFCKYKELSEAEVFKYFRDETKAEQEHRREIIDKLFDKELIVLGERKKDDLQAVHKETIWVLKIP